MDNLIPKLYKNYGNFCNWRMLPSDTDGLRPSERRTLLSIFQIARHNFVKSVKIEGHCIGHFHPHGGIYGTLVQLVHQGFVEGQGNWGSDEDEPAAARYTMAKLNLFIEKLAFELIDYVPWEIIDLDKEPLYLPSMFPICLLGNIYTTGIGFGYRTYIPCFKLEDLYKRLLYLLDKCKRPTIKPITKCEILSSNSELEKLLTKGNAKIKFKGLYEIDKDNYKVSLKSWPRCKSFKSILKDLNDELKKEDIGWGDFSEKETNIEFKVIKQRNRDSILENLIKKLDKSITMDESFDIIVIGEDGKPYRSSVDNLLLNAYKNYTKTTEKMFDIEKKRLEELKEEYKILNEIKPHLSRCLSKKIKNIDIVIKALSKDSKISKEILKSIFSKYTINRLLGIDIILDDIEEKIKEIDYNMNNLEEYVLNKYQGEIR